jgi:hypothetical protein
MAKPTNPRKLLGSTARLATLVAVGVAETACNLQVVPHEPRDAGRDSAADANTSDASADTGTDEDASTEDVDGGGP